MPPGSSEPGPAFAARLVVSLELTIAGTMHMIAGGCVEDLTLDLRGYGFTGSLTFVQPADEALGGNVPDALMADFLRPDLIEVAITVAPALVDDGLDAVRPIALAGLVTDKAIVDELVGTGAGTPVMSRRYRIAFADPAQVLWTQHYPCQLYTSTSMVDVINDQLGERIPIAFDHDALARPRRLIFLHLPRSAGASFWDFLAWYLDAWGGVFTYQHAEARYLVTMGRPEPEAGTRVTLYADDLDRAELYCPEVPRHTPVVLNGYSDCPRTEPVVQAQAEPGIRACVLLRTASAREVDDQVTIERARPAVPSWEARLRFRRMPAVAPVPGELAEVAATSPGNVAAGLVGRSMRVRRLRLRAVAASLPPDRDVLLGTADYHVEMTTVLEDDADGRGERPPFRAPSYPGRVEGKVVREQHEAGHATYQVFCDEETSLAEYRVLVPLWNDQSVNVPCEPMLGAGSLHLPAYGGERVLLAIELHAARIERLLEWPPA